MRQPAFRVGLWRRAGWQVILLLLSSALFVVILLVVQLTVWAERQSSQGQALDDRLKVNVSITLAVLRVLQGLLAALLTVSMARALLLLQWTLISRPRGIAYLSLLSLSGSTGLWGMFRIMFGFGSGLSTKAFAMMRYGGIGPGSDYCLICPRTDEVAAFCSYSFPGCQICCYTVRPFPPPHCIRVAFG